MKQYKSSSTAEFSDRPLGYFQAIRTACGDCQAAVAREIFFHSLMWSPVFF